ncbi:hypothetical protein GA0116948_103160 [Chitinophaga costaii]|uniref:Uncharacterized protein n=1 Tax=Chitinophaga costaii TaxID=1335309 RepID=A0A1C4BLV6_9BACT|nr:hypothetical protein [Chitinophaga costaii]PUZ27556.1 hypothetical protein DCM91_04845 [Chitinophaga costaii]SCC07810.1 hypothetical protein GA0116948_103160 [Chitinophaga costaii]
MKTCRLHKILAIWLLGVFVINITPREFIHLFSGHEDTHDIVTEGLAFSPQHQHCGFLNIGVPPYEAAVFQYYPLVVAIDWQFMVTPLLPYAGVAPVFIALRGPPTYCA